MIRCEDWRRFPASTVQPLLDVEAAAWLRELHWDVREAWSVVEPARTAGQLPGALALNDSGYPVGWTAYLQHGTSLQVMAIVASNRAATEALVGWVMSSPEAARTDVAVVSVRQPAPGLAEALAAHGFTIDRYRYLGMALWDFGEPADGLAPWRNHDVAAARLCARAYVDTPGVRAFAPHDTPDEWVEYIAQLRKGPGCGWFASEFSFVVPAATGDELDAAILITDLGPGTVHVAQLAVDPAARGRGLGRRLVRAALGRAAALYDRATLLVSASNTPAVSLYDSIGFEELATFLVAVKRQPSLSKSVAVATGGESTRR